MSHLVKKCRGFGSGCKVELVGVTFIVLASINEVLRRDSLGPIPREFVRCKKLCTHVHSTVGQAQIPHMCHITPSTKVRGIVTGDEYFVRIIVRIRHLRESAKHLLYLSRECRMLG